MKRSAPACMVMYAVLFMPTALAAAAGPREAAVQAAIDRASAWLDGVEVSPFLYGTTSFRLFAMAIESRHDIWLAEQDEARRGEIESLIRDRLRQALDGGKLREILRGEEGRLCFTEMAVLAKRCADHGLDPAPIHEALSANLEQLRDDVGRRPPALQLLYAVYLPAAGIDLGLSIQELKARGMVATRPPEADLTLADVYYLTHEIFALTDYGATPLQDLSDAEGRYLRRVLSFYALLYGSLNNLDLLAELLICMAVLDMTGDWAYEEGIRILIERQNADGSFDGPDPRTLGRPLLPTDFLHATMNCLGCLLLDRARRQGP